MSDQVQSTEMTLAERILQLIQDAEAEGNYVTVRRAAKVLDVKQREVADSVPEGYKLEASANGTLSEQKFIAKTDEDYEEAVELDIAESNEVHEQVAKMLPKRKERVKKVETEKVKEVTYQLDEEGNQVLDESGNPIPIPEAEQVRCAVCGNVVRKSSIVRRGICPLCFRQLAKNVGMTAPKLEALSDEEFEVILGEENGRRRTQEERKVERTLTEEQFKAMSENLIPVKELFAQGKEQGYGPGRVAQAVGGDRFRHDPVGGYGSVWTPYFYGARNAWYFDKDILNHWDDLKRPEKVKKEKSANGKTAGAGRKGARGAEMVPVVENEDGEAIGTVAAIEE